MSKVKAKKELSVRKNKKTGSNLWAWLVGGLTLLILLCFGIYFIYNGAKDVNNNKESEDLFNKVSIKNVEGTKSVDKEGLLYIYADSCVHCQALKPTIVEYLKKDNALKFKGFNLDKAEKVEINVNGNKVESVIDRDNLNRTELGKIFKKYDMVDKFEGTPTLLYIKDGKVSKTYVGDTTKLEDIPVKK